MRLRTFACVQQRPRLGLHAKQAHRHPSALQTYQLFTVITTLCSKKSDAKIQITITTAYLTRIKYPLSGFNYHLSGVNVANMNIIHRTVSEQQLF